MSLAEELEQFIAAPTLKAKGHRVYRKDLFFPLQTMPESAYGEMIIGSLHRRIGLAVASEPDVASLGNEFAERLYRLKSAPANALLTPREFMKVVTEVLDFPRTSNQSAKRALTILPIVPELANYAAPVRLRGNPWNPGNLVGEVIVAGARNQQHAEAIWAELYTCLEVGTNDDVWARFLRQEVAAWRTSRLTQLMAEHANDARPTPLEVPPNATCYLGAHPELHAPATQFVADLKVLMALRTRVTRRAWLAYLESLLRLGTVAHTQWLCRVHDIVWREVLDALKHRVAHSHFEIEERLTRALAQPWWSVGNEFAAKSRTLAQGYQRARYGLNLVLFRMELDEATNVKGLSTISGLPGLTRVTHRLAEWAANHADALSLREKVVKLLEAEPAIAECRKGFTNNLREFWLYSLAKRQPALSRDAEFDQVYWLQKQSSRRSAPWIAMPGPASLSLATHLCVSRAGGFGTVGDLSNYLACYGLGVTQVDFESGALASRLRGLGLIIDSPDAEAGMGLVDPLGGY
jgi:hypothetical protein